jgi:hypothetical protein
VTLEVGKRYRAIGPNPGPDAGKKHSPAVEVEITGRAGELFTTKTLAGTTTTAPVIHPHAASFWREILELETDAA